MLTPHSHYDAGIWTFSFSWLRGVFLSLGLNSHELYFCFLLSGGTTSTSEKLPLSYTWGWKWSGHSGHSFSLLGLTQLNTPSVCLRPSNEASWSCTTHWGRWVSQMEVIVNGQSCPPCCRLQRAIRITPPLGRHLVCFAYVQTIGCELGLNISPHCTKTYISLAILQEL